MRLFDNLTVRYRLMLPIVALLFCFSLFVALYYPAQQNKSLIEQYNANIRNLAETSALSIGLGLGTSNLALIPSVFTLLKEQKSLAYIAILNAEKKKIAAYNPDSLTLDYEKIVASDNPVAIDSRLNYHTHIIYQGKELGYVLIGLSMEALHAKTRTIFFTSIIIFCIVTAIGIFVSFLLSNWVVASTKLILHTAQQIQGGTLDVADLPVSASKDEFNRLTDTINKMKANLRKLVTEVAVKNESLVRETVNLTGFSGRLDANADTMGKQSTAIAAASEEASTTLSGISSAAEEMSTTVATVATAIEEMSASLNEVAKNCQVESQIAEKANVKAQSTRELMSQLEKSAKEIEKVVEIINDIADQTNLLALNATIEAASAGEAGKGFAVVAVEVKELARQTSQATGQIRSQVEGIQKNSVNSLAAIGEITNVIEEINSISHTIVSAVEEQSATVSEIARNVAGASQGAVEITRNVTDSARGLTEISSSIQRLNSGVSDTISGVKQIRESTDGLARLADELQGDIGKFKV